MAKYFGIAVVLVVGLTQTGTALAGGPNTLSHDANVHSSLCVQAPEPLVANGAFADDEMVGDRSFMVGGDDIGMEDEDDFRISSERLGIDPDAFEMRVYGGETDLDHEGALDEITLDDLRDTRGIR